MLSDNLEYETHLKYEDVLKYEDYLKYEEIINLASPSFIGGWVVCGKICA